MTPFTQDVVTIIRAIPAGRVATYGQIARLAGNPRAARQVVRILHSMSQAERLPWHRVVNAKGEISQGIEQQLALGSGRNRLSIGRQARAAGLSNVS